jgi:negative regulator of flagellin synthesis FlgM
VSLSNVAQKVMEQPDFDRAKVESIKKAIAEGNYPVNPRRIAENFVALEKMIAN